MPNEEALRFLGLLNRGGKCLIGEPILHNMRKGNALVIAETDSKTVLRVKDKGERVGCLILEGASKEELGEAIGFLSASAILVKDTKASLALARKWETRKGDL